jgi:hypothetical protein
MIQARTIAHLIAESDHARTLLENVIQAQDPRNLEVQGISGHWSAKDVMAHITAWETRMMEWLDAILLDHAGVEFLEAELTPFAIDEYNAQVYRLYQHMDLASVQGAFMAHHQVVLDYIARLPEEKLFDPAIVIEGGYPLWQLVADNTFEHYDEHLEQIEKQPWYRKPEK